MTLAAETAEVAETPAETKTSNLQGSGLKVQVAALTERCDAQAERMSGLTTVVNAQTVELGELRSLIGRLATSLGRADILTPPATTEQLRVAYKQGAMLVVLKDCKVPGMNFVADTKIEARQFPLERLIELIEMGKLALAIEKKV